MKKDKIIFKDFGRITNDTENRDERLKAYICGIFDISEIDDVIKDIKTKNEKEAFMDMIFNDIKGRVEKFFL